VAPSREALGMKKSEGNETLEERFQT